MEVGFQKSLQLFVANGYYVFENKIYVDLPDVLGGKPDCVNSPLPRFFARARCPLFWRPPELQWSRCTVETRGVFKHNISNSSFSSTFSFLFIFIFIFLTISRVWLLGRICNGYIMVV